MGSFSTLRRLSLLIISIALVIAALLSQGLTNVLSMIARIPTGTIIYIIGLFVLNIIVVSWRLKVVLSHFGIQLPARTVFKASVAGHYAGLFIYSLVGQVIGRDYVLRHHEISPILISTIAFYEKSALLFVGGSLCFFGIVYLGDKVPLLDFLPDIPYIQITLIALIGFVISFALWRSQFESRLFSRLISRKALLDITVVVAITVVANVLVIASFVIGVLAFYPHADFVAVFSAAAIISFAASLPLTINGWGIRELSAVYILGLLGIAGSTALALSIVVGLCATVVILLAMPALYYRNNDVRNKRTRTTFSSGDTLDINKVSAWVISTSAAVLVFFQLHVDFPGGIINLNLADPFAILALAVVIVHWVFDRHLPHWHFSKFNTLIMVFSLLLVVGFINGVLNIGVTQWALTGRIIGWLVIVGYMAAGYLVTAYLGTQGFRRMAETMVTIAFVIVLYCLAQYLSSYLGLISGLRFNSNFRGFASNRIAFAFQMVICSALMLVYSSQRISPGWKFSGTHASAPVLLFSLIHGVILNGLAFTASRAGLIAESLLMIYVFIMRVANRTFMILSVGIAGALWLLVQLIPETQAQPQGLFSGEASISQHLTIIIKSVEMWMDAPIFGAGLGVFFEKSVEWFNQRLVIHSIPFWFLAEFGIFGIVIVFLIFAMLIKYLLKSGLSSRSHQILSALLLVFSVFGLFHDTFYQRTFWLLLGGCMAVGGAEHFRFGKLSRSL